MQVVSPENLIPRRRYRIYLNTQNHDRDSLGIFDKMNNFNLPIFSHLNSHNYLFGNKVFPDELQRIIEPHPRPFYPRIYTFYEIGENREDMRLQGQQAQAVEKVLDGEMKLDGKIPGGVPGLGKTYTGRGKYGKRSRRARSRK